MNLELNHLNINSFVFEVAKIPILKYGIQEVTLPDVSLSEVKQYNPMIAINQVGDHLIHEDFTFTFLVDEQMNNYRALYHWMKALTFPECYEEFSDLLKGISNDPNLKHFHKGKGNQFSDCSLTILSNHKNPILRYTFRDAFPVNLSGFSVNITDADTVPITATCSMKFTGMSIENLRKG